MAADPLKYVSDLVQSALDDVDDASISTSVVVRKALRIARLRNDWESVLRWQIEMRPPGQEEGRSRVSAEVAPHMTAEQYRLAWDASVRAYLAGRHIEIDGSPQVLGQALPEVEANIASLRETASAAQLPAGLHTLDAYFEGQRLEKQRMELLHAASLREQVLARVRQDVADFLSVTERQLVFGQVNSDAFERNRKWVDEQMALRAPVALEQFAAAYRRRGEGDAEALTHALTSCRRVLKTLADQLYPAKGEVVTGVDGRDRKMTDDRFVMRLCQYASESAAGAASKDVLVSQIKALGERLDGLHALASKGVHADPSPAEVDQCLIQTYLAVGDLLRLEASDSASTAL